MIRPIIASGPICGQAKIVVDLFCFILLNFPSVYVFVNHSAPMAYLMAGGGGGRRVTPTGRSQPELSPTPEWSDLDSRRDGHRESARRRLDQSGSEASFQPSRGLKIG